MRLIDADELKQAEERIANLPWGDWQGHKVGFTWMPHEVQRLIDRSPTIDAVEVVRCKDCKHYLNEHICMYFSRHGTIETSSYAYCSYGERREP